MMTLEEFFSIFDRTYWMVAEIRDGDTAMGLVYTNEEDAYKAAERVGAYQIIRKDPDGTKTVIV